ncbi:hypothetical protein J3R83DRAFT_7270 [Lanmaoa asiatica]|nr:hypothetical protein J3R83DRAFT_7270 [Lanmaoa asiatica]
MAYLNSFTANSPFSGRISTWYSIPLSRLHRTLQEPEIRIDDAALDSWNHDQLENAETLLTQAISETRNPSHHVLASRALVRARLRDCDAAVIDAEYSIKIQPSVIGYIAKGRATSRLSTFHSTHVSFLLLVKAIIIFMAGERDDAISRLDDLIATMPVESIYYVVQARAQRATTG